jgi:hypothetical protein
MVVYYNYLQVKGEKNNMAVWPAWLTIHRHQACSWSDAGNTPKRQ